MELVMERRIVELKAKLARVAPVQPTASQLRPQPAESPPPVEKRGVLNTSSNTGFTALTDLPRLGERSVASIALCPGSLTPHTHNQLTNQGPASSKLPDNGGCGWMLGPGCLGGCVPLAVGARAGNPVCRPS